MTENALSPVFFASVATGAAKSNPGAGADQEKNDRRIKKCGIISEFALHHRSGNYESIGQEEKLRAL